MDETPHISQRVVIGEAQDVMSGGPASGIDTACFYFPTGSAGIKNESLLIRMRGDFSAVRREVDAAVATVSKESATFIIPAEQAVALQIYPFRVASWIGSLLGCLALALTLSGIYGVLAYFVSQRTKEIGIRMALGSSATNVIGMVLNQSMRLTGTGIVIGTGLALGVSRIFSSKFEAVSTFDVLAYGIGIAAAAGAALAAAYFPSRRAATVDPIAALRCD